jgi:hypothetical protein
LTDGAFANSCTATVIAIMATETVSMIRETTGTAIAMIVGVGGVGGTIGTVAESQALRRKPESSDRRGSLHWEKTR